MEIAIVHNPTSGDGSVTADDLFEAVIGAGHTVALYTSTEEPSWQERVTQGWDLVVVAGGDGTVRKVFTAAAGSEVVVTVIALGTCNNVARTLGLPTRAPLDAIAMWRDAMVESRYCLPRVATADVDLCTEGAGAGLFAELIRRADAEHAGSEESWGLLREIIVDASAEKWALDIDGRDASGHYLAAHATVVRETGPNFMISPDADPTLPGFGVVLIRIDQRQQLADYVDARGRGDRPPSLTFDVVSARRVEIGPPDAVTTSVDDRVIGGTEVLTVEARSEFVRVLIPDGRLGFRGRFGQESV